MQPAPTDQLNKLMAEYPEENSKQFVATGTSNLLIIHFSSLPQLSIH
jgi:hypothetical protein